MISVETQIRQLKDKISIIRNQMAKEITHRYDITSRGPAYIKQIKSLQEQIQKLESEQKKSKTEKVNITESSDDDDPITRLKVQRAKAAAAKKKKEAGTNIKVVDISTKPIAPKPKTESYCNMKTKVSDALRKKLKKESSDDSETTTEGVQKEPTRDDLQKIEADRRKDRAIARMKIAAKERQNQKIVDLPKK